MNNNKIFIIAKRELKANFSSPIAYIITSLFLAATGFFFYSTFFLNGKAELRIFFSILPYTFCLFIPAITMKLFAEEQKSGSIEALMTLPVSETQVVLGKFFASFVTSIFMLLPTLFYIVSLLFFGSPDTGPIICGYIGALFLCSAYCAIGVFASSVTKNQIVAFFVSFAITGVLTFIHLFIIFIPASIINVINFFAIVPHFSSIAKGIIDSRDIIYFLTVTIIFLVLTIKNQESKR